MSLILNRNAHSRREEIKEKEGSVVSITSLGFGCPDFALCWDWELFSLCLSSSDPSLGLNLVPESRQWEKPFADVAEGVAEHTLNICCCCLGYFLVSQTSFDVGFWHQSSAKWKRGVEEVQIQYIWLAVLRNNGLIEVLVAALNGGILTFGKGFDTNHLDKWICFFIKILLGKSL